MSNVKPGDFAVFVRGVTPPEWEGVHVLVLRPHPPPRSSREAIILEAIRHVFACDIMWEVEVLQAVRRPRIRYVVDVPAAMPGDKVGALDCFLRRIEPPADTEEVFSSQAVDA